MGSGLLYGALEHRIYGWLKARLPRVPWLRAPRPAPMASPPA
ncbi:MAG TPA: hypothetical protein VET86_00275 [Casimicrobiaceae bacterium]|nr:hypothetical protein [Casimicrobiaceae bacterium]